MSNPFSVQALATLPRGAGAGTDNLTSLASATALGLGAVDQHTALRYDNNVAPIQIKSGASGTSASGFVSCYLITSEDGTVWTDGIDPNSASNQKSKIATATLVQAIAVVANATTYYFTEFSVATVLGFEPLYWAVVIDNESGHALDTTAANFYSKYLEIQYA